MGLGYKMRDRQIPSVDPTRIQCPYCGQIVLTEIRRIRSPSTWVTTIAVGGGANCLASCFLPILLCFTSCCLPCCCVPFCMKDLKTTIHTCPRCRKIVGSCVGDQEFI